VRVALVGPVYPFRGGIAHYTAFLHDEMSRHHETHLFSFRRQYPKLLFPGRGDADPSAEPVRVPATYSLDPLNALTWLSTARAIRQLRPDVLVMQWWVPFWSPAFGVLARLVKARASAKVVYICHNVLPHERAVGAGLAVRFALAPADGFVVHSAQDEAMLLSLFPGTNVQRRPLPTYAGLRRGEPGSQQVARSALGLSAEHVALFFGFVRPYKGLHTLLQALLLVRRSLPLHLLVVGEFWEPEEDYRRQVAELGLEGVVTIVNRYVPNEDLPCYFEAADVAVLPYESATQSAVAQLAFGFGLPVIATDVGGLGEAIHADVNGLLAPPGNPPALAAAILSYFSGDTAARLRRGVRQTAAEFDWSRMRQAIELLTDPGAADEPA